MMKASKAVTSDMQTDRLGYIDGMRGIAALLVVFCHVALYYAPGFCFFEQAVTLFERLWMKSPLNVLTNGNAAVQCFYVLSGFLLTRRIYLKKKIALVNPVRVYVKYLRLVAPAIIIPSIMMAFGLMNNSYKLAEALDIKITVFYPSIKQIITEIFIRPFTTGSQYTCFGPLWTIRYEFLGTLIVSASAWFALHLESGRKYAYILIAISLLYIFNTAEIAAIIMGAFVFDCVFFMDSDSSMIGKIVRWCFSKKAMITLLFVLGAYFSCASNSLSGAWMLPLRIITSKLNISVSAVRAFGIALCLLCFETMPALRKPLTWSPFRFLGKLSPYIYIFHVPIFMLFAPSLYVLVQNLKNEYICCAIFTAMVVVICIVFSMIYMKVQPVFVCGEKKIMNAAKHFTCKYLRK